MSTTGWKSELSLVQEFFGEEPRFPLATEVEHQAYEFHQQNKLLQKLSSNQRLELRNTTTAICGSINNGITELTLANKIGFDSLNKSMETGFNSINTNLENIGYDLNSGFDKVVDHLKKSNRNLEKIDSTLKWGFTGIISKLSISNQKLDAIIHLLNIPDSQKQRKYHIEEGLKCLIKTKSDDFFYTKAQENFLKALEIEDIDYLSLQQLGIIHLYSEKMMDIDKAKKYLHDSIRYSSADVGVSNNKNSSSYNHLLNPSILTTISSMHLARCYYIEENYEKAFQVAKNGLSYNTNLSLQFDLSKYSSKLNKIEECIDYLNKSIQSDRYLTIKALNDEDLASKSYVLDYLNNLTKRTIDIAKKEIYEVNAKMKSTSHFIDEVRSVENQISKGQYLRALQSLEMLGFELNN